MLPYIVTAAAILFLLAHGWLSWAGLSHADATPGAAEAEAEAEPARSALAAPKTLPADEKSEHRPYAAYVSEAPTGKCAKDVSIVRPVRGADPATEEGITSFFQLQEFLAVERRQEAVPDAPAVSASAAEMIFGLADAADPGLQLVRRIQANHPGSPADHPGSPAVHIIVAPAEPGLTGKGSNLLHGVAAARYDWLLLADADIVAPSSDWLGRMLAKALASGRPVAAVPVHRGARGFWPTVYQTHINVTTLAEWLAYASRLHAGGPGGAVLLHRQQLEAIGGVAAFSRFINDDVALGQLLAAHGTPEEPGPLVISSTGSKSRSEAISLLARGAVLFRSLPALPRTAHYVVNYLYIGLLAVAAWLGPAWAWCGLAYLAARMLLSAWIAHLAGAAPLPAALVVPPMDAITLYVTVRTVATRRLSWAGRTYSLGRSGLVQATAGPPAAVPAAGGPPTSSEPPASTPEPPAAALPARYTLHVAGLARELPVVTLNEELAIASFVMLGDTELVDRCAEALSARLFGLDWDLAVGAEAKVIPLLHVLSKLLGRSRYVVVRKSVKGYMVEPRLNLLGGWS